MTRELTYTVVLEPEEEGGFSVHIPALPEAHTQGETVEECLANAREVIEAVVGYRRDHNMDIPPSDTAARIEHVTVNFAAA